MQLNLRYQFVLLYTVGKDALDAGGRAVNAAIRDGALLIGDEAGSPVHRFPLERTADAHRAAEDGAVGKVLIDLERPVSGRAARRPRRRARARRSRAARCHHAG